MNRHFIGGWKKVELRAPVQNRVQNRLERGDVNRPVGDENHVENRVQNIDVNLPPWKRNDQSHVEYVRQRPFYGFALNAEFLVPKNFELRGPFPPYHPPEVFDTQGKFYIVHSAMTETIVKTLRENPDITTAQFIEQEPFYLQELSPLLGYVPIHENLSTLLKPIMLQTFKSRDYRFDIIRSVVTNRCGLPIQMCVGDTERYIPMRVSMCGFGHVYCFGNKVFQDTAIERLYRPPCPMCRHRFYREDVEMEERQDLVYGCPFRYNGVEYPEQTYELLLRVEENRSHPRIVLRIEPVAPPMGEPADEPEELKVGEEPKVDSEGEPSVEGVEEADTLSPTKGNFREDSDPFDEFKKVVETPHVEPEPEPEPELEPEPSINTQAIQTALDRDLLQSLKQLLENEIRDPVLQLKLNRWAVDNDIDLFTFNTTDEVGEYVCEQVSVLDYF